MKKKLLVLSLLAITASLSLAGCSFLEDIIDDINEQGESGGQGDKQVDKYDQKIDHLEIPNIIRIYHVDDLFIIPTTYAEFEDGKRIDITNKVYLKNEVDLSSPTEDGKYRSVEICYQYQYTNSNGSIVKVTLSKSYQITVKKRNDVHIDPVDDEEIKTLQLVNVQASYNEGDTYRRPNVYAIKHDGSKVDVTSSCSFTDFDINNYGFYNVTVTYLNHIVRYEIIVINEEENAKYPMIQGNDHLNSVNRLSVIGESYALYLWSLKDDGSYEKIGDSEECDSFIPGTTYSSDDDSIASIDEEGVVSAKKEGTTYVYMSYPYSLGTKTFRCKVKVEQKKLTSLDIDNYRYSYYSGRTFSFAGKVKATYQNGYSENIVPEVDYSNVNMDEPGKYTITISYTVNGITLSEDLDIEVFDSASYVLSKTHLDYDVTDYTVNSPVSVTALPHHGELKSLVVPVRMTDSNNYISNYENVREDIRKCFFGSNEEIGWRSVKTYYEEESLNEITYNGVVSEVYDDNHDSSYYYEGPNTVTLKNNIIDWYFANHPEEDIKSYDVNHDGYFDSLNLVYLVPDAVSLGIGRESAPGLWGMVKNQRDKMPNVESPVADSYFWVSYDFMYPTKDIALERTGKSNYSQPNMHTTHGEILEPRTFIHEVGHMFGIDDYYSYSEDDIFFAGHANMQTLNMMGHDPYSTMLYNWTEPYIPETSTTITIGDFQKNHDVILLTPSWNNDNSPFDEYFLIDLYVPDSGLNEFDATIKKPIYSPDGKHEDIDTVGVRIWHVDARIATASSLYTDIVTNPTLEKVSKITDNSYGSYNSDSLAQYDRFMELQLVRNELNYDYVTSSYLYSKLVIHSQWINSLLNLLMVTRWILLKTYLGK